MAAMGDRRNPHQAIMDNLQVEINGIPTTKIIVMGDFNQNVEKVQWEKLDNDREMKEQVGLCLDSTISMQINNT